MTCGVIVPVTRELIEEVTLDTLAWRRGDPGQVAQDPCFTTAIYRAALDSGIMDHVAYEGSFMLSKVVAEMAKAKVSR